MDPTRSSSHGAGPSRQSPFPTRPLPSPLNTSGGSGPGRASFPPPSYYDDSSNSVRRVSGPADASRGSYRTSQSSSGSSQQLTSPGAAPPRAHSPLVSAPRPLPSTAHYTNPAPPVSPTSPNSFTRRTAGVSLPPGTFCTATSDHESLSVVNLAGLTSPAAIKERILTKLHIGDDEFFSCTFFLTRIGGGEGRHIEDEELWDVCAKTADGAAVTIFVKQQASSGGYNGGGAEFPSGTSAQSMRYGASARDKEVRRSKSPSTSSRSEGGHPGDEAHAPSPGGLRSDRPSWTWAAPRPGAGHRASGSYGSTGNAGTGTPGLSPPIDRGRERSGSLTPTPPDEYARVRSSDGDWEVLSHERRPSAPATTGAAHYSSVQQGLAGPPRRLPGPMQLSVDDGTRQRTQTTPVQLQYRPELAQTLQPLPRPLPAVDPRSSYPQYPYSAAPPSNPSSQYHNLSLQASYSTPSPSAPMPQYGQHSPGPQHVSSFAPQPPRIQQSKSVDGLRGQYVQPDQDYRPPPIPGPVPPQYLAGRIPLLGAGHPGAQGSRSPALYQSHSQQQPSPQQSRPPPPPQIFPSHLQNNFAPPPNAVYPPFDLRSRPMPPQHRSAPILNAPSPYPYPPPPPPAQRAYTSTPQPGSVPNGPNPGQVWQSQPSLPLRRPTTEPRPQSSHERPQPRGSYDNGYMQRPMSHHDLSPRLPDVSGHISLRPGETLQGAVRPRRQSEGLETHPAFASRPPVAAHMRAADPSNDVARKRPSVPPMGTFETSFDAAERYGVETQPRRESGGSMSGERKVSGGVRRASDNVPKSLQPGGSTIKSPSMRDSGSSFASSTSSRPGLSASSTPSAPMDGGAYGGMEDDSVLYQSPPVSARSSMSASGPLTPGSDQHATISGLPSLPSSATYPDGFGDAVDDGATWFATPKSSTADTAGHPVLRQDHLLGADEDGASGTVRAHDWAELLLKQFPQGDEGTVMRVDDSQATVQPTAPAASLSPTSSSSQSSPATKATFVEDPAFYFPVAPPRPIITSPTVSYSPLPTTPTPSAPPAVLPPCFPGANDFDDDEDDGATFFAGAGPTVPANVPIPASPIGVSLYDEPSSRSPILDRQKEKRPTLTLQIETPSSGASPTPTSPTITLRSPPALRRGTAPASATSPPSATTRRVRPSTGTARLSDLGKLSSPAIVRRVSFAARENDENDWAVRPPVETVLEHLEAFFPEHDLDKPIVDAATPPATTPSTDLTSPAPDAGVPIPPRRGVTGGLGYKKSIRIVAQDQKRKLLKASSTKDSKIEASTAASLLRRKSTKLFGTRLEEVTSAQMKKMDVAPIPEDPLNDDPDNFSFKWIKGELIGRGTYGRVYLAYNITAAEFIAVKQVELPKTRSDKEDLRQQGMVASLKAEIELLKDLEHPKIVEYLGMEETIEHLSIFLEYVPGGSVGRIVRTHGKFEESVIKFFTYQILEGLEYLHSLGILHRDLKADNILCDHQGRCKISDFGTSKRSNDIYNDNANMSMQGTIFWMAPEVIQNFTQGQGYSAKADIWSLGCICLEMFAGRRPWSDVEALGAMFKLGAARLAPPVPEDVILSTAASHFLSNCLSIDSEMRPRASQLMRHSFLALPPDWTFLNTALYHAIASTRPEEPLAPFTIN